MRLRHAGVCDLRYVEAVDVSIQSPSAIDPPTDMCKCQTNTWASMPYVIGLPDMVTFTVTDGGAGDADLTVNGQMEDPVEPGAKTFEIVNREQVLTSAADSTSMPLSELQSSVGSQGIGDYMSAIWLG